MLIHPLHPLLKSFLFIYFFTKCSLRDDVALNRTLALQYPIGPNPPLRLQQGANHRAEILDTLIANTEIQRAERNASGVSSSVV